MLIKKYFLTSLAIASFSFPMLATANQLLIINKTDYDSTCTINKGGCSDMIRDGKGVTHANSENSVDENDIKNACIFNKSNCTAEVHMTNNCTGPVVAIVYLDVKKGILHVDPPKDNNTHGFKVTKENAYTAKIAMDGQPASKNFFHKIFGL